jgi:hypothetical protein
MKRKKSFPFLFLFVIHTIFLCYTFYKRENNRKSLFILLLTNIGFAYVFEFIILNLFNSYQYKPKFLKNRYLDNIFGAFLSQGVFLPFTANFISAFGFSWKVKIMFAIYFSLVERLFIKLGVFSNKWWRTLYTIFLIPVYFRISDLWYKNLLKGNGFILYTSFFMMTWVTGVSLLNVFSVLRKIKFGMGRFYTWHDHFILAPLYWFLVSLCTTYLIKDDDNWKGKLHSFMFMKILDTLLEKLKIVKSNLHFSIFNNIHQLLMIYITSKFRNLIYSRQYKNVE